MDQPSSDESPATGQPDLVDSLPDRPLTEAAITQIADSETPAIRDVTPIAGTDPESVEAFQLDLQTDSHLLVFDPRTQRWCCPATISSAERSHDEVELAIAEAYNDWLRAKYAEYKRTNDRLRERIRRLDSESG